MRAPWEPKFTGNLMTDLARQGAVFDPGTMMLVAGGVQALGAIASAQASAASYEAQAQMNEANAKVLKNNSIQASREANVKEDANRERARILRGRQIAAVAQSGIGFEGSGGDLVEQSDINSEMDALSIRYEGETRRQNLTTQSSMQLYEAGTNRANASSARTSGYISAIGSAASAGASYGQYQRMYGSSTSLTPSYGANGSLGGLY